MFRAATLRVLSLTPLLLPTGTPAPRPSAPGYGAGEAAGAAGPGDGRTPLQEFWWAPWVLAAAVLLAAPAAFRDFKDTVHPFFESDALFLECFFV